MSVTHVQPPSTEPTQEPPEKPPFRIWRRLAAAGAVLTVVLIIAGAIGTHFEGRRIAAERAALEAHLDATDPDWRLDDLEKAREQIPDEENSAIVVVHVAAQMPKGWYDKALSEALTDLPTTQQLDPEQVLLLEQTLKGLDGPLEHADRLADMPRGRHRLTWSYVSVATLLPDQQETRKVASLLNYDALRRAQKGDADGALRACRGIVNAGRSLGDEPLMISALIRCAILSIAGNAVERTLAQGVAGDKELALLQKLLDLEQQHPTMRIACRGERASSYDLLSKLADGRIPARELDVWLNEGERLEWWQRLGHRGVGRREPTQCLRLMTEVVESTKLPEQEQRTAEQEHDREAKGLGRDATYARMLAPAVVRVGQAIRRKTALMRCLMVLVAVERYRLRHPRRRWPDSLEALKPDLLARIPADPYDGMPLRYCKLADGVVVYAIGEDDTDNGGNLNRARPMDKGTDQGYRLWDEDKRRQPSPRELPPPEVEAAGGK